MRALYRECAPRLCCCAKSRYKPCSGRDGICSGGGSAMPRRLSRGAPIATRNAEALCVPAARSFSPLSSSSAPGNWPKSSTFMTFQRLGHLVCEIIRIDGGKPVEPRSNLLEQRTQLSRVDQSPSKHLVHVEHILTVTPFDLGQGLGEKIVVVEAEGTLLSDERAAILPVRKGGNEIIRRSELHVQIQFVFQPGKRLKNTGSFGIQLEIDVDRGLAPTFQDRRCPSGKIDGTRSLRGAGKGLHQCPDLFSARFASHRSEATIFLANPVALHPPFVFCLRVTFRMGRTTQCSAANRTE